MIVSCRASPTALLAQILHRQFASKLMQRMLAAGRLAAGA
jgi:hypothetical protein